MTRSRATTLRVMMTLLALCASGPAQVPRERGDWAEATRSRIGEPRLDEGFAALRALPGGATPDASLVDLGTLAPRDRVDLVRLALWSDDEATALGAAMCASAATLDVDELRRFARIASPRCLTLPSPFDFDAFRDALVPGDVTRDLLLAAPRPREQIQYLGAIHRALRGEHLPLLAEATRSDDWFLRTDAMHYLAVVSWSGESHRDATALAILAWNATVDPGEAIDPTVEPVPAKPLPIELPEDTSGLPRPLQAVLRRLFLEPDADESLLAFRPFAMRWLLDSKPVRADLPLLRALLAATDLNVRAPALALIARLDGDDVLAILGECARGDDGGLDPIALSALARRGDDEAFDRLRARTRRGDTFACAGLLACGVKGIDSFAAMLRSGDDPAADRGQLADLLIESRNADVRALFPDLGDGLDRLAEQLGEADLDGGCRARLLRDLPELRTRRNCAALVASFGAADVDHTLLAMLEVAEYDALVRRLRDLDPLGDERLRFRLEAARLAIGDPDHGLDLLALVDAQPELDAVLLGRSASIELRAALVSRLKAARAPTDECLMRDLAALAAVEGVDERLVRALQLELVERSTTAPVPEAIAQVVLHAIQHGARKAFEEYLAGRDLAAAVLPRTGAFPATSVIDWLRRVRDARETGHYASAIAELALGGDADARHELTRALDLQLYPWFDDLPAHALAGGDERPDPARWFDALSGNCCAFAAVASRLEDWYEVDAFVNETGLRSRTALLREHFTRFADDWHWSRSAQRYVILMSR